VPIIISEPVLPSITFFADASSRNRDFPVAGGFAVSGNRISEVEDTIALLRDDAGMRSEFHWSEYRGGDKKPAYEALVRYSFALVRRRHAALHLIIPKFKGYPHKAKQGENRDTSISRMYYQLCLHRVAAFYGRTREIHIRLDSGNDCEGICAMRNELCADAYHKHSTRPNCVRTIEPMSSHNSGIIQMADVVIGAVAAKRNAIQHTSPKGELADYVLRMSNRPSWDTDTLSSARFLTVWNHRSKR
jgi:hypothetical protein